MTIYRVSFSFTSSSPLQIQSTQRCRINKITTAMLVIHMMLVLGMPWTTTLALQHSALIRPARSNNNNLGTPRWVPSGESSQSLFYRIGDVEDYLHQRAGGSSRGEESIRNYSSSSSISSASSSNADNRWWKSLFPGHQDHHQQYSYYGTVSGTTTSLDATSEEISQRVDEYLKFLNKRYEQIHELDREASTNVLNAKPTIWQHRSPLQPQDEGEKKKLPQSSRKLSMPLKTQSSNDPQRLEEGHGTEMTSSFSLTSHNRLLAPAALSVGGWKPRMLSVPAANQRIRTMWSSSSSSLSYQARAMGKLFADVSLERGLSLVLKRIPEIPAALLRLSGGWHAAFLFFGVLSSLLSCVRNATALVTGGP